MDKKIVKRLKKIFGKKHVMHEESDLLLYQYDASLDRSLPDAVVFAQNREQVAAVARLCFEERIPLIPRGAGSNLSGGTIPIMGGIILQLSLMNRILEIDTENQCAVVEPGVYNLALQQALAPYGFYYAPDPASQRVSTIGGNIAENAGGPHCVKYGVTSNHVLGVEMVTAEGEILNIGGKAEFIPGYDLLGTVIGSEGTLGIITKAIVKILPLPEETRTMLAVFQNMTKAANAVTEIMGRGIIPATLEMMDKPIIETVEKIHHLGYPADAEAILLLELDGPSAGMNEQEKEITEICRSSGATSVEIAKDGQERDALWQGRRLSFGSLTMLQPSIMIADGTVPRSRVPQVLEKVMEICQKYDLKVGNVFHAGDGNLHPFIIFDERNEAQKERVMKANEEILRVCVEADGTLSGEHGIGLEKKSAMRLLFSDVDISAMMDVKNGFDEKMILNPGKIFPSIEVDNL
ncbi:MAG: FAD-binding protein [Calditrichaeota bacterium]|nr:FAD-binding protein [Calditrichota bacterium]